MQALAISYEKYKIHSTFFLSFLHFYQVRSVYYMPPNKARGFGGEIWIYFGKKSSTLMILPLQVLLSLGVCH